MYTIIKKFAIIRNRCYIKSVNKKEITQRQPLHKEKKPLDTPISNSQQVCNCIIQCFADIVNVSDFESLGDKLSRQC